MSNAYPILSYPSDVGYTAVYGFERNIKLFLKSFKTDSKTEQRREEGKKMI